MGAATQHRTTPPRRTAAAAAAAAVFLSGVAAGGALSDRRAGGAPEAATGPAAAGSVSDPDPNTRTGDVVPGFTQSRDGARAAAVAYTSTLSQRLLYLEPTDVEDAIRAVAADASADTLARDARAALETAREPLAAAGTGPTWWAVRPLAVRVDAYSPARARVSVWVMRVLSRQGVVVPQSSWVTETVEVVWERGDWRLWSDTTTPGPTPVLDGSDMPASAAELDLDLAGFEVLGTEGQR